MDQVAPLQSIVSQLPRESTIFRETHKFPNIAKDIALMGMPTSGAVVSFETIAQAYNISLDDLEYIMSLPSFKTMVNSEVERYKSLGPHGGFKIRSEMLATDLQEKLYQQAITTNMDAKDKIKLLEVLTKSAGIGTEQNKNEEQPQGNGVSVTINFPRLDNPKLNHLHNNAVVIEADDYQD